jgi:hypothetical protein
MILAYPRIGTFLPQGPTGQWCPHSGQVVLSGRYVSGEVLPAGKPGHALPACQALAKLARSAMMQAARRPQNSATARSHCDREEFSVLLHQKVFAIMEVVSPSPTSCCALRSLGCWCSRWWSGVLNECPGFRTHSGSREHAGMEWAIYSPARAPRDAAVPPRS